jgi:DNA-binding NarL/FixJ family response regulator
MTRKIRVLLADDHGVVREGLRLLLETQEDMEVVGEAGNGRDAVLLAAKLKPDLVVMDIAMPELNGIEATRRIRDEAPGARVLILTMKDSSEYLYWAMEAGARGYLLKETAGRNLFHRGERYLGSRALETLVNGFLRSPPSGQGRSPLERLSSRERQVLQMVAEGNSSASVAAILCLSPKTVETYRSRLMRKLGVKDLPGLIKFTIRHGITSLD